MGPMGKNGRSALSADAVDRLRALLLQADALRQGIPGRELEARAPRRPRPVSGARRDSTFEIQVLERENQLRTTLRGFIDAERAEDFLAHLQRAIPRLTPGFDVISDVSSLGCITAAAHPVIRRGAAELVQAGMRRMVRVVGATRGGAADIERITEGLYRARVVTSVAEAEAALATRISSAGTAVPPSPPDRPTGPQTGALRRAPGPGRTARRRR